MKSWFRVQSTLISHYPWITKLQFRITPDVIIEDVMFMFLFNASESTIDVI